MYQVGAVVLGSHGIGTIIGLNEVKPLRYFEEDPVTAVDIASRCELLGAIVAGVYNKERYPFVVKWEDGYIDVYSACELEIIP